MAVPMKNGGMSKLKVIFYVILSGITTGVGAICLSFAAGAMLYIVSGELIPESNQLYHGRMTAIGNIVGFLIGMFAMNLNI